MDPGNVLFGEIGLGFIDDALNDILHLSGVDDPSIAMVVELLEFAIIGKDNDREDRSMVFKISSDGSDMGSVLKHRIVELCFDGSFLTR